MALGKTVAEIEGGMSAHEINEWMAYYGIEPFGEERADLRAGIITAGIRAVHITRGRPEKPTDFMPEFGSDARDRRRLKDPRQLQNALIAMAKATGGKVIDKRNGKH